MWHLGQDALCHVAIMWHAGDRLYRMVVQRGCSKGHTKGTRHFGQDVPCCNMLCHIQGAHKGHVKGMTGTSQLSFALLLVLLLQCVKLKTRDTIIMSQTVRTHAFTTSVDTKVLMVGVSFDVRHFFAPPENPPYVCFSQKVWVW